MFQFKGGAIGAGTGGVCKNKAEPATEATGPGVNTIHPEVALSESLRDPQSRRGGVRKRGDNVETDYTKADRNTALSKIQALTGMVLAQEEIETLLGQELNRLKKKKAGAGERFWRLLTRCSNYLL